VAQDQPDAGALDVGSILILIVGAIVFTVWLGGQLAARLHGAALPAGFGDALTATVHLPQHLDDPRRAWPPRLGPELPSAPLYWASTIVAVAVMTCASAFGVRVFAGPRPGTARRKRLGIDTRARLARPRDLRPLIVPGPTPGRMILGRVDGRLVATEDRRNAPYRSRLPHRQRRVGDRSAVCIIGPSRCGKTTNTISGILEWEGPAILSSVKTDILGATLEHRQRLGEVRIFDPTGCTGHPSARWSPLRAAATVTGAQKAARALVDAAPRGNVQNIDFFQSMAKQVMWSLLFAASVGDRTMEDVVHWILTQDRLLDEDNGTVLAALDKHLVCTDDRRRHEARLAYEAITAIWALDERTRGDTFATCQTIIDPFQDPGVAAAASGCDIDLDWLLSGANTLYLCAPLHEQDRLSVVFGGVIGDLLQQAYEKSSLENAPLPNTLLVMDEAGNTPTRWLPAVASTCASIGILLVTIWQSKAQIDAAYGILADSVLTNHGTKIIFSGISDPATMDYAAKLVGDEEVLQRSISADTHSGPARNITHATTYLPLMPGEALRRVPPGEALLVYGTLHPAHLMTRPHLPAPANDPDLDPFAQPMLALPPAPKMIESAAAKSRRTTTMERVERLAIIGDVGGHRHCLHACLRALDVDVSEHRIPEDLTIIQVGDLIGGGPNDDQLVADVDDFLRLNPGRWIQLLGNWEARHLGGTNFGSPHRDRQPLANASIATLRRWLTERQMRVAIALRTSDGREALVTHAGVTQWFWKLNLDSTTTAAAAAEQLDALRSRNPGVLHAAGELMGGSPLKAGPLWATATEVWTSWTHIALPFDQIHGHTTPYWWRRKQWWDNTTDYMHANSTPDHDRRHLRCRFGDRHITTIDPGLGRSPRASDLQPLRLHRVELAAGQR